MSVDAAQVRPICELEEAVATKVVGAVGGVVSTVGLEEPEAQP